MIFYLSAKIHKQFNLKKMKKVLVFIAAVAFFACSQPEKGFEITVNIEGAEGQILLEKRGASQWIPVDTADIVGGTAVLKGEVAVPEDHYLSVMGQRAKTILFVENTKMTVTGNADNLEQITVTGSKTHDEYNEVNRRIQEIGEEYMALYQQAREAAAAGNEEQAAQLMQQVEAMYESTNTMQADFVRNNPGSFAAPYFLSRVQFGMEVDELDKLVSALDPKLKEVPSIVALAERIEKLKTVAVGQIAPDFTMNDPDGNPVKFSEIYKQNEYTLIDFWAAWCGPCRQENPNIVAVYNDYKDKGFSVFGVSLDRDRDAWLKAIDDDKLTWHHVSDLAYWNNAAAQMYAVNSIPASLIVDKNGKIIAKNKRDEALREAVSELLD
ncbi:MAG TPA: AhpC/TSA family protein [Mariniphaga anaerophila]|uniref:AhpC/TSA family protein n=1 Tax=Mariniphaga anaerophila TaxID=1484053 RepID=A0A831LII7_9BACT|nr:AhpC/TSA family protein [Mariniphaga anaerophila]